MKTWSFWYPDIMQHVAGCPYPVVDRELLRSAQDFLMGSRVWNVVLTPIAVTAGTTSITIPMDADKELIRIEEAWYDGKKLGRTTKSRLDALHMDDWNLHTGTPSEVFLLSPGIASLYPLPTANASTGLKLRVSVKPSEAATGITDEIAVKYRAAIEAGAKAKLMLYPGKSWSNTEMAAAYLQMFNGAIASAKLDATKSFVRGRIASRPTWS